MTPLVYEHIVPQVGTDHQVAPKRVQTKAGRPTWRTVCESCDKFVMMVPALQAPRVPTVFARL
jgi:hypothetical protein